MIGELTNHLWQSTLFAIAAGLLTVAFRKNRAEVRYWLWFGASIKFFIPFSLPMGLGSYAGWAPVAKRVAAPAISFTMVQITQPFPNALASAPSKAGATVDWVPLVILGVWLCGFGAVLLIRSRGWLAIRAALRSSTPVSIPATVEVRSSPGLLEPGVVGLFRPILLLPEGIAERLRPPQFEAVLAHELCHVRRRDNLTSAIHMIAEAVFWFHPLVWWIGARLIEERERACDEAVLSLGNEPRDYAEGILNVCKSYLESPLSCVSGVTGSNLKKRMQAILTGDAPSRLTFAKKLALAAAGMATLAVPIVVGIISAAHVRAQSQPGILQSAAMVIPKFEEASIKPCEAFRSGKVPESPGRLQSGCKTLQRFMQGAYGSFGNGHVTPLSSVTITGGPAWTDSDLYEIDAQAGGQEGQVMMKGPMLQALLEDRFKLKIRRETREIPVYELTVDKGGPKLQPFQGSCIPWDYDHPNPGPRQCATARPASDGIYMEGWTMADLCYFFLVTLGQPVIDKTGNAERFNVHLALPTEAAETLRHGARGAPGRTDSAASTTDPSLVSAVKTAVKKLGLNLEATNGPGEFIVIDSAERPSEN